MSNPTISVIMSVYNGESYLKQSIESILKQNFSDFEFIIINDGSTDQSLGIIKQYAKRDCRIVIVTQDNIGLTKSLNKGIGLAKGKYIAFLDSDDVWLDDKLKKQVSMFRDSQEELGLVYCRTQIFFDDESKKEYVHKATAMLPEGNIFAEFAKENFIPFSSAMVDREKFYFCGGFPAHFLNSTDYYVFLRIASRYLCMAVQEVCCKCRVHGGNLSAKQRVIGALEGIDALREFLPDKRVKLALRIHYSNLAIMYAREKQFYRSLSMLLRHGDFWYACIRFYEALIRYMRLR